MSKTDIHTQNIDLNWKLISLISEIDRFDAAWHAIERREGQSLKELKSIATVRSVGASTRIEGSKLSDEEVDILLKNLDISMDIPEPLTNAFWKRVQSVPLHFDHAIFLI
jgi:hypothetical protein